MFCRLRTPQALTDKSTQVAQANYFYMPQLSGDDGDKTENDPNTWLTLTVNQYQKMSLWAQGKFVNDVQIQYKPLDAYSLDEQPEMLTRGSLEPCVGGPFFPGIEMTFLALAKETFSDPFRINAATFKPGDVMKRMALPWQADFYECNTHWWPAQRPDDVITQDEYDKVKESFEGQSFSVVKHDGATHTFAELLGNREPWARGLQTNPDTDGIHLVPMPGDNDMVKYWSKLGFVVKKNTVNDEIIFIKQERKQNAGMPVRELFYKLQHIEDNSECLLKARQFADDCLANGQKVSEDLINTDELFHFFDYSKTAFEARMSASYNSFVDEMDGYSSANDSTFKSYGDLVQRIIQMAPFNLTDGSWLRHINTPGPEDEVRALLFSILQDERGNGDPSMNHCNIYLGLCHEVGFYPPPVSSEAFAKNNVFLDSAFSMPVFELAISQFTENYYPEILGMTLQLEWSVVELKPTIEVLKYYGINPHFYVMHVGIDNAVNGHGRRAIDAIDLYLDNILSERGEQAMQKEWKRIWNGYVAFAYKGTLGTDIANLISKPLTLQKKMEQMVASIKEFGSYNHNEKTLGPNRINDWFNDPAGFLTELQNAGYIIPGKPNQSKFFSLLSFENGPMYRVFTEDEIQLWKDWTLSLTEEKPTIPLSIQEQMIQVIKTLKNQQMGEPGHARANLKGPLAPDGQPVAWWFNQDPKEFMKALWMKRMVTY